MTAVKLFERRRELRKAMRLARMLAALDDAAGSGRKVRARPRATLGRA